MDPRLQLTDFSQIRYKTIEPGLDNLALNTLIGLEYTYNLEIYLIFTKKIYFIL